METHNIEGTSTISSSRYFDLLETEKAYNAKRILINRYEKEKTMGYLFRGILQIVSSEEAILTLTKELKEQADITTEFIEEARRLKEENDKLKRSFWSKFKLKND